MSSKRVEHDIEALATLPSHKAKAPAKPMRAKKKPTTTPTSLLCELMRLKAQQKYLECNQVKLNANNFLDDNDPEVAGGDENDDDEGAVDKDNGGKDKKSGTASRRPSSSHKVAGLINDIDRLKLEMDEKLRKHHVEKRGQLQEMWHYMNTLKEDVFQPERLSLYTVNVVRERIISLNGQLERLSVQNAKELQMLREEYEKMERENDFVWKGII